MLSPYQNGMVKWLRLSVPATLLMAVMLTSIVSRLSAAETSSLTALPTVDSQADVSTQEKAPHHRISKGILLGVGVSVLAAGWLIVSFIQTSRRNAPARPRGSAPLASFSGTNAIGAKSAASAIPMEAQAPATEPAIKPRSSIFAKGKHANGAQRRKTFDYNRYFTDLMTSVSGYAVNLENFQSNGRRHESVVLQPEPQNGSDTVLVKANSDLLGHQKALIEDQQRLIQEQSKVIEEKSRLIAEKSQLLKMQSELIDSKLL